MRRGILITLLITAVAISGCSTLSSINPFSNEKSKKKKEQSRIERYDDLPMTKSTGSIPGDSGNATYTEEDLKAVE